MVKSDLRENGFFETSKYPKKLGVNVTWIITTAFLIIGSFSGITFVLEFLFGGADGEPPDDILMFILESFGRVPFFGPFFALMGYVIFFILLLFAYLFLKLFMTILFSHQSGNIKLKLLEYKGIPICSCREAFKVWQTVLIYLAPIILMYSLYIFLCLRYQAIFILMLFFMLFFMSFDLTLVFYVIGFKIKHKIDYISIDYHIYDVTLYKQTYIKVRKKPISRFLILESEKNIANGKFNWKKSR